MSSFSSVLSLLKIRGIPPIKIRIFDYDRLLRPSIAFFLSFFVFVPPIFCFRLISQTFYASGYEISKITACLHYCYLFLKFSNMLISQLISDYYTEIL